jgi:hypothetical protein
VPRHHLLRDRFGWRYLGDDFTIATARAPSVPAQPIPVLPYRPYPIASSSGALTSASRQPAPRTRQRRDESWTKTAAAGEGMGECHRRQGASRQGPASCKATPGKPEGVAWSGQRIFGGVQVQLPAPLSTIGTNRAKFGSVRFIFWLSSLDELPGWITRTMAETRRACRALGADLALGSRLSRGVLRVSTTSRWQTAQLGGAKEWF